VGLTLLDSIIVGAIFVTAGQTTVPVEEEVELEVEEEEVVELVAAAHEELLTVVLLKVIAAVCAIALPLSIAPPPGNVTDA